MLKRTTSRPRRDHVVTTSRPRRNHVAFVLAVSAAAVLMACSSGRSSPTRTAPSALSTWCQIQPGWAKGAVLATMGPPHGSKVPKPAGIDAAEWDVGGDILLATFVNGQTLNLQAYAGSVPYPAELGCQPFRHADLKTRAYTARP